MRRNSFPREKNSDGNITITLGQRGNIFDCGGTLFSTQLEIKSNIDVIHSLPSVYAPLYIYAGACKSTYPNSEYLFSQLLDLFEIIFNHNNMPVALTKSNNINMNEAYKEEENSKTKNPFLLAVKMLNPAKDKFPNYNLIICEFDGREEVIGMTSPFTLLCPSSNITNTHFYRKNPNYFHKTTPLEKRSDEFISYMSELLDQINLSGVVTDENSKLSSFRSFLKGKLDQIKDTQKITPLTAKDYAATPFITINFKEGEISKEIVLKNLAKSDDVRSPYKILSTKELSADKKTPLVLKTGLNGRYFNEYNFPDNYKIEGNGTDVLPIYNYTYNWLNPLTDFLESELLILDYEVNKEFLRMGKKREGIKRCFLPLKPKFFEYFTNEDVNKYFEIEMLGSGKEWKVRLTIPVSDKNINALQFEKIYTMNDRKPTDTIGTVLELRGDDCPYLAFWPSLKSPKWEDYYVFVYNTSDYKLQIDSPKVKQSEAVSVERERAVIINKYKMEFPEYLQVVLSNYAEEHHALICPFTNKIVDTFADTDNVYVSIDFGTTNTNVGVHIPPNVAGIWSFDNSSLLQFTYDDNTIKEEWSKNKVEDFSKLIRTYFIPEQVSFEKVGKNPKNKIAQIPFGSLLLELRDSTKLENKHALCNLNIPFFTEYGEMDNTQLAFEFKWGKKNDYINKFLEEVLILTKSHLIGNGVDISKTVLLTAYPMVYSSTEAGKINTVWENLRKQFGFKGHRWLDEGSASKLFFSKETGHNINLSKDTYLTLDIGGGTTDYCITSGGKIRVADSLLLGGRDIIGWFDMGAENPLEAARNPIVRFIENKIYSGKFERHIDYQKNINSQLKFRHAVNSPYYSGFENLVLSNPDFAFSKIIIGYFFVSVFYYLGQLFKTKKELNSSLPSLVCIGGNSSKFLDWLVSTEWENSISKHLVCNLFNDFFMTGYGHESKIDNSCQIYKSNQPKNEVVLGLLLAPPMEKEFKDVYKNRYCLYGDSFKIGNKQVSDSEEQIRETENNNDGSKNLKIEKGSITDLSLVEPERSNFYRLNKKFLSSLEDLELFADIHKSEQSREYFNTIKGFLLSYDDYTNILRNEIELYVKDASEEISTPLFILLARGMLHKIIRSANGFIN